MGNDAERECELLLAANRAETDFGSAAAVARRQRVHDLRAAGALGTPVAKFLAAGVLVTSELVVDVAAAEALAMAAMPHERRARRLAATAYDRLRRLRGAPQKFGTEVVCRDGRDELWPVDPLTTDSERAKWDVPPLADLRRRLGDAGPRG
jgi:hypothetical protein